jgi:probable HAF family extracellular repeat protein
VARFYFWFGDFRGLKYVGVTKFLIIIAFRGGITMNVRKGLWLFVLLVSTLLLNIQAQAAIFQGLGDLAGGDFNSSATAISADGSTVVGQSASASGTEAFRWTSRDGIVGLGDLAGGSFYSSATAVSADGAIIVGQSRGSSEEGYDEAFRWTSSSGMVGFLSDYNDLFCSVAYAVSADGATVVGSLERFAFRWTSNGGWMSLPSGAHGLGIHANGVSADGSIIVGGGWDQYAGEALLWTSSGDVVGLGHLANGLYSSANAVSADGSTVVGWSETTGWPATEAFLWTSSDGMVGLGQLAGGELIGYSTATSVSADGSIVVGNSTSARGEEAFIWDDTNGMRSLEDVLIDDYGLDLTGWDLTSATGISADGQTIVGYGINPDGHTEAWIATVPIPGAIWLLGPCLISIVRSRRKWTYSY